MDFIEIYPKNKKILFIGPYPPPLGGVSVHMKRLIEILRKKGHKIHVFDASKKYKLKGANFIKLFQTIYFNSYDIIHIQRFDMRKLLILLLFKYFKKSKIYYTDHNPRLFDNTNKLTNYFKKRYITKLDYLVVVGEHIIDNYKENKVDLPGNVLVMNAFLPPPLEEENEIIQTYSNETKEFIRRHKPIIIANAWQVVFYRGVDLYGLDLCVELTYKLKNKYPEIGFLFALANEKVNIDYVNKIRKEIKDLGIDNNFHFLTGQKELWPLFKKADLCIRPTVTDGDALSIRESLYFNCPVLASDVVRRPKGTILFKSRDADDLYCHVREMLGGRYAIQSGSHFINEPNPRLSL